MRNINKKLNRNKKLLTKIIIAGTLLTAGASTLVYTNKVNAKALPVATTKDYNKLQKLSKQPGAHYVNTRKWYTNFTPGENVQAVYFYDTYKSTGSKINPGIDGWERFIGAGSFNGKSYFIQQNPETKKKYLIPAEYCQVPYAYKLKSGHKPVYNYFGSLANAWSGYNSYREGYGETFTETNVIYLDDTSKSELTLAGTGQNIGKNKGFWIGKTPITFYVAGNDKDKLPTSETQKMYPVYNYDQDGELRVTYIKTEDLAQFEPTTVTYKPIGTITNKHAFKPAHKKMDF